MSDENPAPLLPADLDIVRFQNVGMRYGLGPEVLHDVSFSLAPGSFHFLTGPSGAGKSTLLKLIYLAERPSRGLISLFGHDTAILPRADMPPLRRKIGVVYQDFRLLEHLTAIQNVALPLKVAGRFYDQMEDHVSELLRWVGLGDQIDARAATLSGGEKQRVAIARAVIARPQLLVADEPTGNLDDEIGARILRLIEELNKIGTTVVIATHNAALIEKFRHPRLHLENGELALVGGTGDMRALGSPAP